MKICIRHNHGIVKYETDN